MTAAHMWIRRIAYGALFIAVPGFFVWFLRPHPEPPPAPEIRSLPESVQTSHVTVAKAWRWDQFPAAERRAPSDEARKQSSSIFSAAEVHAALQHVELTDAGDVVLDHKALSALQSAFASLDLNATQLEELQRIVRAGLPGKAGEQAATVIGDYYQYQAALKDFEAVTEPPVDLETARDQYEQRVALRQHYLGYAAAEKLFAREQAHARFTLDSMRIQSATELPEAQRRQLQDDVTARVPAGVLSERSGAEQLEWERRHAAFERERQAILDAGMAEVDKRAQIEALLRQHFGERELEAARRYSADRGG